MRVQILPQGPLYGPDATADRHPTFNRTLVRLQLPPGSPLLLPCRPTVGQRTLNPPMMVRIHLGQPFQGRRTGQARRDCFENRSGRQRPGEHALRLPPVSDASNNSMFACLSSRSERGQHPPRPPIFKPAKTKQSSRVSLTDEEAGASPAAGASFLGHEEESNPPALGAGYTRSVTGVPDHFQRQ